MPLSLNRSDHWQLPNGFELRSGDHIEVLIEGIWVAAVINLRPQKHFQIWTENGQVLEISEQLSIRIRNRDYVE